jgi:OOP family OmpA-OmpF porin
MAGSILDSLMGMLGPQVVGPVASQLGESTETVQRGLQTGSAAMLAGLAAKVGQPGFLSQIFSLVTNPANTSGALSGITSNLGSLASGATSSPLGSLGGQFLSSIFGSNMSTVTDTIGRSTGLASSKVGSLLTMAAPLVLGVLGQHVRQNGLSAGDLGNTLKAEAPSFQRFLPAGLGSLLGGATSAVAAAPAKVAAAGNRWLWPVIILVALVLAALWFFEEKSRSIMRCRPPRTLAHLQSRRLGIFSRRSCPMALN